LSAAALVLYLAASGLSAAATLDIYFIDVEGGQSTLVVTPAGQSLLIDTGYPSPLNRDPDRIMAAVRDAHLTRIDYLLITHLHEDHNGGAAELARRLPIGTFIDYGAPVESGKDVVDAFTSYEQARMHGRHLVPSAGDRLPLDGMDVEVVSAAGTTIKKPLSGAGQPNPACAAFQPRPRDITAENPRSIGVRLTFGAFRFLDLGDLGWNKLGDLVCPDNLIGEVDAYLVAHHANGDSNVPALLAAIRPRVAFANNGAYKGATPNALKTLHEMVGTEEVWQLHRSELDGAENSPERFIANLDWDDKDRASWIELRATEDGRFTVINGRTGWSRTYEPRGK
jgi:beta-lactamase superfamily II metal-dependent hydrolase